MSKVAWIVKGILRQEMRSVRVLMGYMLGLALLSPGLSDFFNYITASREPVNILEAFIVTEHQSMAGRCWVLGYLLIVADAPFVKANTYMILHRSGRCAWSVGMLFYVLVQALLYTICFAAVSTAAAVRCGFWGQIWSSPVYELARDVSGMMAGNYNLSFEGMEMMRHMTVYQAFGITFTYMLCYLTLIGVLLYVCNLVLGGFWGFAAVAVVHLGGIALSFFSALPWCPAHYVDGAGGHWRYPCISLAFLLAILLPLWLAMERVDISARTEGGA